MFRPSAAFAAHCTKLLSATGPLADELIAVDRETVKLKLELMLDRRNRNARAGACGGTFVSQRIVNRL